MNVRNQITSILRSVRYARGGGYANYKVHNDNCKAFTKRRGKRVCTFVFHGNPANPNLHSILQKIIMFETSSYVERADGQAPSAEATATVSSR